MMDDRQDIRIDPKYAAPYPQEFYRFWPKHAIRAGGLVLVVLVAIVLLAFFFRVPSDPTMPPLPDEGAYIPAPEWYLFLLYQPFWYLTGDNAVWRPIGTFWLPVLFLTFLFLVPLLFGRRKTSGRRMLTSRKLVLALCVGIFWIISAAGVVGSGYPAKTTGCPSCHNPMMGERQALPPADMGRYYKVERQRQINVGGYRAGDTSGLVGSYKDANWQLRHFYEPTMTW